VRGENRELLNAQLEPAIRVRKKRRTLPGSRNRIVNPDLVFNDGIGVGDVKYRISTGDIGRSHLNQVTTFATAYHSTAALIVAFGTTEVGEHVEVGTVSIDALNWNTNEPDPSTAAAVLAGRVDTWLANALQQQRSIHVGVE
jgi:hypothetical protein